MSEKKEKKPTKKAFPCSGSIADAVGAAIDTLNELYEDINGIVENAEGGLAETSRIQTLSSTRDSLEFASDSPEVELHDKIDTVVVYWTENRRKGTSRADRCGNALSALEAARDGLQEFVDGARAEDEDDSDDIEDAVTSAEEAINTIDEWISDAEGAEFPGMYG